MKLAILLFVGVIARQAYSDEPEAIFGGQNAYDGQFPHQVSLQIQKLLIRRHICGGTLISNSHVVTAAHCVLDKKQASLIVVTGTITWKRKGQRHNIKCIQVHPGYTGNSNIIDNDIAVITLAAAITPNQWQAPIRLASTDYTTGEYRALVSGWGKTNTNSGASEFLQYLEMRIMSPAECQTAYYPKTSMNQICTYETHGKGVCNGDSGGPLICNGELVGVVSWGILCARGRPDVFTSVYHYRNFIKQCQEQCP